jgi:hypothetical protein
MRDNILPQTDVFYAFLKNGYPDAEWIVSGDYRFKFNFGPNLTLQRYLFSINL